MGEEAIRCPKCGSEDLIDWGTSSRMCRRCHEVFVVETPAEETTELFDPSARAQALLEEIRTAGIQKEDETPKEEVSSGELPLAAETERLIEGKRDKLSASSAATKEVEFSASKEFEDLYAERKAVMEQEIRTARLAEETAKQESLKQRKPSKAAAAWIVGIIITWLLLMIICQIKEC